MLLVEAEKDKNTCMVCGGKNVAEDVDVIRTVRLFSSMLGSVHVSLRRCDTCKQAHRHQYHLLYDFEQKEVNVVATVLLTTLQAYRMIISKFVFEHAVKKRLPLYVNTLLSKWHLPWRDRTYGRGAFYSVDFDFDIREHLSRTRQQQYPYEEPYKKPNPAVFYAEPILKQVWMGLKSVGSFVIAPFECVPIIALPVAVAYLLVAATVLITVAIVFIVAAIVYKIVAKVADNANAFQHVA